MAEVDITALKGALKRAIDAYLHGDLVPVMAMFAEDVVWETHAKPSHYRFGGRREGRAGVIEAFSIIAAEYNIHRYKVEEMTGEGDVIWARNRLSVTERRSNKPLEVLLVNRWQFRDGRIVSVMEFFDTAGVLDQMGRLEMKVA